MDAPYYVLGNTAQAEYRLGLLNELTAGPFVEKMKQRLPTKNVRILNVGCGSGHLEERLSTIFSNSYFVGIDISPARIEEAKKRALTFSPTNSYTFICQDIRSASLDEFDIVISRAVLSHLAQARDVFDKLLGAIRPGGFICIDEATSSTEEYYCSIPNSGIRSFKDVVAKQQEAQKCSFEIGFTCLKELMSRSYTIISTEITQPILRTKQHKAIWRLGLEELGHLVEPAKLASMIASLKEFEDNPLAFSTYVRALTIFASKP